MSGKRLLIVTVTIVLLGSVAGVVLNGMSSPRPQVATAQVESSKTDIKDGQHYESIQGGEIRSFGNGVYKFPFVGDKFNEALAEFIGTHTNLEFVSGLLVEQGVMSPVYGVTKSYTVVFREKSKP